MTDTPKKPKVEVKAAKPVEAEPVVAEVQEADAELPQEAPTGEEVAAPEPEAPKQHPWQIGFWRGKPNYQCPHKRPGRNTGGRRCPFVTVDLPVLQDHVDKVHPYEWLEGA